MTSTTARRKPNILYLIDDFESEVGGTEQNLVWLLRNIPDAEFEKHFLVFSTVWACDPQRLPIVPRQLGREVGCGARTWGRRIRAAGRFMEEKSIDLVHVVTTNSELAALLSSLASGLRVNILLNRRDIGYHWTWRSKMVSRLVRCFGPHYLANSEAARQAAHRIEGVPLHRIDVIRNPISERRFQDGIQNPLTRADVLQAAELQAAMPQEQHENAQIVGMLASVRPIKDHVSLLQAAVRVLTRNPNTVFLMVGATEQAYQTEMAGLAEQLGVANHVLWFGPCENPYRILPLFDVAVLSSHSESFSNAVLEYAASGRAIVVSDVGGLGELVRHEETGLLVPPQSPEDLACAINRLLENAALREKWGVAARNLAWGEFAEQTILGQYVDLYRRLT